MHARPNSEDSTPVENTGSESDEVRGEDERFFQQERIDTEIEAGLDDLGKGS